MIRNINQAKAVALGVMERGLQRGLDDMRPRRRNRVTFLSDSKADRLSANIAGARTIVEGMISDAKIEELCKDIHNAREVVSYWIGVFGNNER